MTSGRVAAISSGVGPCSSARLGSQKAMSKAGLPMQARFQSTSSARPSRTQRLSLRTSKWSSASPPRRFGADNSSSEGRASSSQAAEQRPRAKEGLRVARDLVPAGRRIVRQPPQPGRRLRRRDVVQHVEHRGDERWRPGRRPECLRQILEQQQRAHSVLPAEQPRRERGGQRVVDEVLGAQRVRCCRVDRLFREHRASVGEPDEPAVAERVAAAHHR